MKNCPICETEITYTSKPTLYTYKNNSIEINQSGKYCAQCNEVFLSANDLKSTKLEIANFKRTIDHFLTTDELKRIRKKSHLTQQDASSIFGGGIRAFHKYESAEVTQNKPLDILFRLMDLNKISLSDIRSVAV